MALGASNSAVEVDVGITTDTWRTASAAAVVALVGAELECKLLIDSELD